MPRPLLPENQAMHLRQCFRVTVPERKRLQAVAAARGITASDVIRQALESTGVLSKEVRAT